MNGTGSRRGSRNSGSVALPPSEQGRSIPRSRRVAYAALVLVAVWAIAEGVARIGFVVGGTDRWDALEGVLVAAGFEQLHSILEPDPQRFWRVRAGLEAKRLKGHLGNSGQIAFSVSTDEYGRRRMPAVSDARFDAVFLGDSCTFGVGVEGDETFVALLQQRIPGLRAINAASPGYTAYQGRVTFETAAFARPPAAVVVSFMFNDDLPWDGRGDLEHARNRARLDNWLIARSRLLQFMMRLRGAAEPPSDAAPARRPRLDDAEYASELIRIVEAVRARDAEALLVAWPLARQMPNDRVTRKQVIMGNVARELGVPFVDLVPHFRAQSTPVFADAVHANAAGNRLVADVLEPELRKLLER